MVGLGCRPFNLKSGDGHCDSLLPTVTGIGTHRDKTIVTLCYIQEASRSHLWPLDEPKGQWMD